ncbi:MAG: choice-of-anchor I family protein [Crocosphaera sp.]
MTQILKLSILIVGLFMGFSPSAQAMKIGLSLLGTYETGIFDDSAAEIPAYDPATGRLFVSNSSDDSVNILDINNPTNPTLLGSIVAPGVNSVAVKNGVVAVAQQAATKTNPGIVNFYNTSGGFLNSVTVGALPDMATFNALGNKLLVANEGEPNDDYTVDPVGSVSVIDLSGGVLNATVNTVGFDDFNIGNLDPNVRIFGPNASIQQDLEPEYIAVSGSRAWVTLQENNAIAIVDLETETIADIVALEFKDYGPESGNALDASDEDGEINIASYDNVFGMYQPDAIAAYEVEGETYLVIANEGDAREYEGTPGFVEEARIGDDDIILDPTAFPNGDILKEDEQLGRLKITTTLGDTDGDGDFDELYSFGGRSISILDEDGNLIWDSGDQFEQLLAELLPDYFNASNDNNEFDDRSDDKGPEPEGITIGYLEDQIYALIGLERVGGVMIYNVTDPANPSFINYSNNRDFNQDVTSPLALDLGPEGLLFISSEDSPIGSPLLVVANEVSGTTSIYQVSKVPEPSAMLGLMMVGLMGGVKALKRR